MKLHLQRNDAMDQATRARLLNQRGADIDCQLLPGAKKPFCAYLDSNAYDLYAYEEATIQPGQTKKISTGVMFRIPVGTSGLVQGRSGMTVRGLQVALGLIDSNYRGVVYVSIYNSTKQLQIIPKDLRMAQILFVSTPLRNLNIVSDITGDETERGTGGYGSSGI